MFQIARQIVRANALSAGIDFCRALTVTRFKPRFASNMPTEVTILKFAKLSKEAFTPTRGSEKAAGYDLHRWLSLWRGDRTAIFTADLADSRLQNSDCKVWLQLLRRPFLHLLPSLITHSGIDYHLRCLLSEQTAREVGNIGLLLNHFLGGGILKF